MLVRWSHIEFDDVCMNVEWSRRAGMKTIDCSSCELVSNAYGLHCAYIAFPENHYPAGVIEIAEKMMDGKIMTHEQFVAKFNLK